MVADDFGFEGRTQGTNTPLYKEAIQGAHEVFLGGRSHPIDARDRQVSTEVPLTVLWEKPLWNQEMATHRARGSGRAPLNTSRDGRRLAAGVTRRHEVATGVAGQADPGPSQTERASPVSPLLSAKQQRWQWRCGTWSDDCLLLAGVPTGPRHHEGAKPLR